VLLRHAPAVATDYRNNTYFRGPQSVYVYLYLRSTLRWTESASALSLTQAGEYPYEDHVAFTVTSSAPAELTFHFRISAWADGASVFVNGVRQKRLAVHGQFTALRRE
jgi:DUF1680 family protein